MGYVGVLYIFGTIQRAIKNRLPLKVSHNPKLVVIVLIIRMEWRTKIRFERN